MADQPVTTERLPLQAIIVGRYHDGFSEIERRWRLVERRYLADLSEHLEIRV